MSSSSAKKRAKSRPRVPDQSAKILAEPPPGLLPSKEELLQLLAVVSIAASVAAVCHFSLGVLTRRPKPFCDSDESSLDPDSDFCVSCPENGRCYGGELECIQGFRKHGRMCLEDGESNQTAQELAESIQHYVCDAFSQVICGRPGKIWVPEADIMKVLDNYKLRKLADMKDDTFMFVKHKAMESIKSSLEIRLVNDGNIEFKCPDMSAELYKPLLCCARQWIHKHLLYILGVCALLIGLISVLWSMQQKRSLLTRAEQLYEQVCEILEENAIMAKGTIGGGERCVVASWLRDHLLLPRERKNPKLWKKVEELILEDSRIAQYPKLIKGESKIVWEWQVEGSLGPKQKKEAVRNMEISGHSNISSSYKQWQTKDGGDPLVLKNKKDGNPLNS